MEENEGMIDLSKVNQCLCVKRTTITDNYGWKVFEGMENCELYQGR